MGIHNVLALRGDSPNFEKEVRRDRSINGYAADLVSQISDLKKGIFLDEISDSHSLDFCVGVAGYPEKHFEAANLKLDVLALKKKVDAGADYVVTQMFFDNQKFFDFVKACREAGITVPIIPGLKVLRSAGQVKSVPKTFHVDLPEELVDETLATPEHASQIGQNWARKQLTGLLEAGFKNIHFYIMNDTPLVVELVNGVRKL